MQKVALITFHRALNYGAALQTYATCKILRDMGYEVELIDVRIAERQNLIRRIATLLKKWRFARFRKRYYPKQTVRYHTMTEIRNNPPRADYYMVGSDQTWNPLITGEMAEAFFLDFGKQEIPRIAFSVSFGNDEWPLSDMRVTTCLSKCVERFEAVSVRERSGLRICGDVFHREAVNTLDPTLLNVGYGELSGPLRPQGNIVSYRIAPDDGYYRFAARLREKTGKPLLLLGALKPVKGHRYVYPQRIERWVRAIAEADLVITDSFHGMVFSILYERPFVVFIGNPKRIGRIRTLLQHLGLENRLWTESEYDLEQIIELGNTPIDYSRVKAKLQSLRSASLLFLQDSLNRTKGPKPER